MNEKAQAVIIALLDRMTAEINGTPTDSTIDNVRKLAESVGIICRCRSISSPWRPEPA
jgi:hypothetical protein